MSIWLRLTARLGSYRAFWWLRSLLERAFFLVFRYRLAALDFSERSLESLSIARQLFVGPALAAGAAAVSTLVLVELGSVSWNAVGAWIQRSISPEFTLRFTVDERIYDALLTAVASVTGVFLGLYFTAISTIAATVYVTVPHDIRSLLLRDRVSTFYLKILSFLTFVSLLLLGMRAMGIAPAAPAVPLLLILSAVSIFSFARLGERVFYFADPTQLSWTLIHKLSKFAKASTSDGTLWQEASFQDYYRRQGASCVTALEALHRLSRAHKHLRGTSDRTLTSRMVASLLHYATLKSRIPTKSFWFGRRPRHKQWFLTTGSEVWFAAQTQTTLQPELLPDPLWVEDGLLDPIIEAVREEFVNGSYETVGGTVIELAEVWEALGRTLQIAKCRSWTEELSAELLNRPVGQQPTRVKAAQRLAVIDGLALLPISLELGAYKSINELDRHHLRDRIGRVDWTSRAAPYQLRLPTPVLASLEEIQAGVDFEYRAEGRVLTPKWYILEIVIQRLTWQIHDRLQDCLDFFEDWYPSASKRLTDLKDYEGAAAVLARGFEATRNLAAHIPDLEPLVERLNQGNILSDLRRPQFDWIAVWGRIEGLREKLTDALSKSLPGLSIEPPREDVPDYFGQAVHHMAEECVAKFVRNDVKGLERMFGALFFGVVTMFDRVRTQLKDVPPQTAAYWLAEPIIDLMTISGIALVASELHQDPALWKTCENVWSKFLASPGADQTLRTFAGLRALERATFAITPRAELRTRWTMEVSGKLAALPRRAATDPYGEGEADHPKRLIRNLARRSRFLPDFDAADLFVARYLTQQPQAKGLDFGVRWVMLRGLELLEDTDEAS